MYPRGRRRSGFWFTLRKRRTFAQKRSTSLPVLVRIRWTMGEKMNPSLFRILQWKESLMISWQTFSVTWKIDDSHLKWWGTDLVANLTEKTDYARAEICKFNPCLCIISLNTGIFFFSYSVFKKVSRDRKHCNSNLFNIPGNSTSLLKPKICLRRVSEVLKYIKQSTFT